MLPTGKSIFVYRGGATDVLCETIGDGAGWIVVNASSDVFLHERLPAPADLRDVRLYVTTELRRDAIERGRQIAASWFRRLPPDAYTFDGMELADPASALSHFVATLDTLGLADQLATVERPARIVVEDDGSSTVEAFRMVCAAKGVPLELARAARQARQPHGLPRLRKLAGARAYRLALAVRSLRRRPRGARLRLLFTDYFRFHPLIADLAEREEFEIFILPNTRQPLRALFTAHDGPHHLIPSAYLTLRQWWSLRGYERRLRRGIAGWIAARGDDETYRGYPVMTVARDWLVAEIVERFPALASFALMARGLLTRARIGQVVVNQDQGGYPRLLCVAGKQLGIRTICYQHGLSVNMAGPEHISDVVAAWGPQELENYRRHGRHRCAARMQILGDPFLRDLRMVTTDRRAIAGRLGLNPDRPVVLVTCERFVNYYSAAESVSTPNERMVRILEAAGPLDVQLLLRFKWEFTYEEFGDGTARKREIARRYNTGHIVIDPGGSLYERLALADVVVVTNSTVGLEAMLFGKPVLAVEEPELTDHAEYVTWGAALKVTTVEEIRAGLQRTLGDASLRAELAERQRSFVEFSFANLHDADPLQRAREFLLRMPAAVS